MKKILITCLFLATILIACNDDVQPPEQVTGNMEFVFRNKVNTLPLAPRVAQYSNSSGEDFIVTTLNYYVSNFELVKDDGSVFTIPQEESYFLIRGDQGETSDFSISDIPVGNYVALRFTIGVDREKSMSGVEERTGALDIVENSDMYWAWNPGYIFMKLEGTSSHAPESPSGERIFRYHIGGFGGYDQETINNIKTVQIDFDNSQAIVAADKTPRLIVAANLARFFDGVSPLSIAANPTVMFAEKSIDVANNYEKMFVFDHLHNQ